MLATAWTAPAVAECDFDKPAGGCRATITIDSTSGSKPSYHADATVHAPTCSKVEYYLDNTPQTTVVRRGNSENENFFGTKPITPKSITGVKCTAYAEKGVDSKKGDTGTSTKNATDPNFFRGTWEGQVGLLFLKAGLRMELQVNGNRVAGTGTALNDDSQWNINGTVTNGVMNYAYTNTEGDYLRVKVTRTGPDSVYYWSTGSGIVLDGNLTRQ